MRACAAELGINRDTAGRWSKQLAAEIATQRREELENLAAEYQLLRAGRLQKIGGVIARLDAEIATRDLREIPTAALLYLRAEWQRIAQSEAAALDAATDAADGAAAAGNGAPRLADILNGRNGASAFLEAIAETEAEDKRRAAAEKRKRKADGVAGLLAAADAEEN